MRNTGNIPGNQKVAVIGGGNVGASAVHYLAQVVRGEVVMIDVLQDLVEQKGKDITRASNHLPYTAKVTGTTDYSAIKDASIVIHTAGIARKPGMDRMDLLKINAKIAKTAAQACAKYTPHAILIVVANPVDVITLVCYRESGFPKERVIGMAGVLDGARYCYFIAEKMGIQARQVQTVVMGGHGDAMVPLTQFSTINGIPADKFIDSTQLVAMEERTCSGGAEIVKYLKKGSAYYAPAASAVKMAEAILEGNKKVLTASVKLNGEYGFKDIFLGVPVIIGPNGIEKIITLPLTTLQNNAMKKSAEMVQSGIDQLAQI